MDSHSDSLNGIRINLIKMVNTKSGFFDGFAYSDFGANTRLDLMLFLRFNFSTQRCEVIR